MTPDDIHRRLWQLVNDLDGRLDGGAKAVVGKLLKTLAAEGYQAGPETQAALTEYLDGIDGALRAGIAAATRLGSAAEMSDELVARLTAEAFTREWQDGRNLSNRLWALKTQTRQGFGQVIDQAARRGRSVNALVYDLQRQIEVDAGLFGVRHREWNDWATELAELGKLKIGGLAGKRWDQAVADIQVYLNDLAATGTQHAARTAFAKIRKAVAAGNQEQIGEALYWWMYDKQLYYLKRIARTELATAQHRAIIASTEDDEDVIGYQWRLSASHPEPDICDYYAGIEMGLGKGIWPKDAVPRAKAHPHCMCLLVPRVTRSKTPGALTYADFLRNSTPKRRDALLPQWAQDAIADGATLDDLIRPDGLGLIKKNDWLGLSALKI